MNEKNSKSRRSSSPDEERSASAVESAEGTEVSQISGDVSADKLQAEAVDAAPLGGDTPFLLVRQVGSAAHCPRRQRATLTGLGLRKMHSLSILPDTPCIHGMLRKVSHLVEVVDFYSADALLENFDEAEDVKA